MPFKFLKILFNIVAVYQPILETELYIIAIELMRYNTLKHAAVLWMDCKYGKCRKFFQAACKVTGKGLR